MILTVCPNPSIDCTVELQTLNVGKMNRIENKIAYLYYWDIEIHEMDDLDEFVEEKFVLE